MKSIIFFITVLTTFRVNADVITCHFSEPFYKLVIDTEAKTMTRVDQDWFDANAKVRRTKIISANIKVVKITSKIMSSVAEIPRYQVEDNGMILLGLDLSYQGHDGVLNYAYPYETYYNNFIGGCTSDKLKRHSFVSED